MLYCPKYLAAIFRRTDFPQPPGPMTAVMKSVPQITSLRASSKRGDEVSVFSKNGGRRFPASIVPIICVFILEVIISLKKRPGLSEMLLIADAKIQISERITKYI